MSFSEIGVVGSGKMGAAIFRLLLNTPFGLTLVAVDEEEADRHAKRFLKGLERAVGGGRMSAPEADRRREAVRFTHRLEDLARADLVIEAVFEDYAVKTDLFRRLEAVLAPDAMIVSNTSGLSIEELRAGLRNRERFCGLHFFHPVVAINLVEIIRCGDTPSHLVQKLQRLVADIERKAIVVRDAPGSAINWVLSHYYIEALYILEEGRALPSRIDQIAKDLFYVGPCESIDVIGVDLFIGALSRALTGKDLSPLDWVRDAGLAELPPEKAAGQVGFHVPTIFRKLLERQRLGRKTSGGLYLYKDDCPVDDLPEFYIHPALKVATTDPGSNGQVLGLRLLYSLFVEAIHCLRKGVADQEAIDLGVREVLLMKEGPFSMMRKLGEERLRRDFASFAEALGKRFEITGFEFLEEAPRGGQG